MVAVAAGAWFVPWFFSRSAANSCSSFFFSASADCGFVSSSSFLVKASICWRCSRCTRSKFSCSCRSCRFSSSTSLVVWPRVCGTPKPVRMSRTIRASARSLARQPAFMVLQFEAASTLSGTLFPTLALSLSERIPQRCLRFEPPNRPLSRLRHPLPPWGGEGVVHPQCRFMGRELGLQEAQDARPPPLHPTR